MEYTLVQALSELYAFNPKKKKDAKIIFQITDGDDSETLMFGKHWHILDKKWSYFIKENGYPCLGSEEKHFVSNLFTNNFAKTHMIYAAQQGTYIITKMCDSRNNS